MYKNNNALLKLKSHVDKFLFSPSTDPDGMYMLKKLGFWNKPSNISGFVWMFLPDVNRMEKAQQEKYLKDHPSILTIPKTFKNKNLNGLPSPKDNQD